MAQGASEVQELRMQKAVRIEVRFGTIATFRDLAKR